MHSHLREADFTQLWWIQGTISSTLTVVGVDKTTTKGLIHGVLAVEHSTSLSKQHPLVYKGVWELSD
jgi:hypothetical protein